MAKNSIFRSVAFFFLLTGFWDLTDLEIYGSKNELVCENAVTGVQVAGSTTGL